MTKAATGVGTTSATLHGTVDPEEVPLSACYFEYGTSTSYGQSAECEPSQTGTSGNAAVEVEA